MKWCERCLLITESPKTSGRYRYLIWVYVYIPYTGLAVFSFAICSCSCVYCDFEILKSVFSTLQSRRCRQLTNSCLLRGLEGSMLWIDILCFCYWFGIFSKRLLVLSTLNMFSFAFLSLFCNCLLILVMKSCISCKYVLRPNLRYIDVCEICMRWLIL